ncbi:MAG: lysophospholipase [Spirochaetes bacterium]|nr:lysophospholipase [Spirochaetota bacterium]
MMFLVKLLLGLAMLLCAAYLLLVFYSFRSMFRPKTANSNWVLASSLESGDLRQEVVDLPWLYTHIDSPKGYQLAVYALRGRNTQTAIFHHGFSWCWYGMQRYMEAFIARGWNVVALDSRGHGQSGGKHPSFGRYEKEDLKAVVDWTLGQYPDTSFLLSYGESMGAATVLQHAAIDARVQAVIADCPFASADRELDHQLSRYHIPAFLRTLIIRGTDLLVRTLDGYSMFEASPQNAIMQTAVPILFIHGSEDRYVPWKFSVEMYEQRRSFAPTQLLLVPEARHARSRHSDQDLYDRTVRAFVDSVVPAHR